MLINLLINVMDGVMLVTCVKFTDGMIPPDVTLPDYW